MGEPVFKKYAPTTRNAWLFESHMVRFVDHLIDQMDLEAILSTYKVGGTSSYHPRTMLKVVIYGYVERITSCRIIAKAVGERIPFMWLAGGLGPDFRTINNFRKHRLPGVSVAQLTPG